MDEQHDDRGFTLVEVLLVILVLGILATVVVAAAGGFASRAESTACDTDARVLMTATEAFLIERALGTIPAADTSPDGYELTLVAAEVLRSPSDLYDLDEHGNLAVAAGSPCTV